MIEDKILNLFVENYKVKFSDIEKSLKIRSNKLAYYLKKLVDKKILVKDKENYSLSEEYENILPYISDKRNVLPIILVKIGNKSNAFLYLRTKRPFKDKLALPGGRLIPRESIPYSVNRIMKEKFNINAKFKKVTSISLEHVKKSKKTVHSFLLILIEATTKDKIKLLNIEKNKKKIIPSDYKILKDSKSFKDKIKINTVYSKD